MPNQSRTCGGPCRRLLPPTEFGLKSKATGQLQSKCKECSRQYAKQHYRANRNAYVEKARLHNLIYRERNSALVTSLLANETCVGCGTNEDLTYYTGGVKKGQPVYMTVGGGLSKASLLAAVERSTPVCRTCLGEHFGKSLEFWQHLNAKERAQLQAKRKQEGYRPTPPSYFRAYRRTDGTLSASDGQPLK